MQCNHHFTITTDQAIKYTYIYSTKQHASIICLMNIRNEIAMHNILKQETVILMHRCPLFKIAAFNFCSI